MVDSPGEMGDRETELRRAIEDFFFGFRAFTALPDQILATRGLGRTHHRILYFVRRQPGLAMSELLATLGVSKQAVHAPLKELQRQGLVTVVRAEHDGRVRVLNATDEGMALEAELSATQMHLLDQAFGQAGAGSEQAWRSVMEHLRSTLQRPA